MRIVVESAEVANLVRAFSLIAGRHQRFVVAMSLTRTAKAVRERQVAEMNRVFDRPMPWTVRSLYVRPAFRAPSGSGKQDRMEATVEFKDTAPKGNAAAKYLQSQINGGGRRFIGRERALQYARLLPAGRYTVPADGADMDSYGNMNRGQIVKMLSYLRASRDPSQNRGAGKGRGSRRDEEYFVGEPGGGRLPLGVYKRSGRGVVPVLAFIGAPSYSAIYNFEGVSTKGVAEEFPQHYLTALERALAAAR